MELLLIACPVDRCPFSAISEYFVYSLTGATVVSDCNRSKVCRYLFHPFVPVDESKLGCCQYDKWDKDEAFATLKQMAGYGEPEGDNNIAPASISERTLREVSLQPFRYTVKTLVYGTS